MKKDIEHSCPTINFMQARIKHCMKVLEKTLNELEKVRKINEELRANCEDEELYDVCKSFVMYSKTDRLSLARQIDNKFDEFDKLEKENEELKNEISNLESKIADLEYEIEKISKN